MCLIYVILFEDGFFRGKMPHFTLCCVSLQSLLQVTFGNDGFGQCIGCSLKMAKENLNHTVCKSKATRDLIDLGVQYVYLYSGNDGMLVTRVVIDKYHC